MRAIIFLFILDIRNHQITCIIHKIQLKDQTGHREGSISSTIHCNSSINTKMDKIMQRKDAKSKRIERITLDLASEDWATRLPVDRSSLARKQSRKQAMALQADRSTNLSTDLHKRLRFRFINRRLISFDFLKGGISD